MIGKNYTATILVKATVQEAFESINDIAKWWTADLDGSSKQLGDEFTVHFGDVHVSTQKLIEVIPHKKVTWLVTNSKLNFIKHKQEWDNTNISFEITENEKNTQINFIHIGLVPEVECYNSCTKGWDYFIKGSLAKLLTERKGTPGL